MSNATSKVVNESPVKVISITKSEISNKFQAELRQEIEEISIYLGRIESNMQDDLVNVDSTPKEYASKSTRVCWVDVNETTTVEQLEKVLAANPKARIYRVLSTSIKDVLDNRSRTALGNGLRTIEEFQASHLVQTVDNASGETSPVLWNGMPQYSSRFFSKEGKADVDLRKVLADNEAIVETAAETAA